MEENQETLDITKTPSFDILKLFDFGFEKEEKTTKELLFRDKFVYENTENVTRFNEGKVVSILMMILINKTSLNELEFLLLKLNGDKSNLEKFYNAFSSIQSNRHGFSYYSSFSDLISLGERMGLYKNVPDLLEDVCREIDCFERYDDFMKRKNEGNKVTNEPTQS